MNFHAGQKVLCVNDYFRTYCAYPIKKGLVYTIHGFYRCVCGSDQVTLMEIPFSTYMGCRCHRTISRRQSYFTWRFIPLDYFEKFIDLSSDRKAIPRKYKVKIPDFKEETAKDKPKFQNQKL